MLAIACCVTLLANKALQSEANKANTEGAVKKLIKILIIAVANFFEEKKTVKENPGDSYLGSHASNQN